MGSCLASDVINVALNEVGYKEGGNNWTKYARDLDSINYFNSPKQNVAWCGTFNYWSILMACTPEDRSLSEKKWDALYFTYQPSRDNCACACRYGAQYFRNEGAFYSTPKVGDIAFYGTKGNEYHQGLVYKINGNSFQAIEGNHNDKVDIVSRTISECSGFGRPRYDDEPEPTPDPPTPTPPEPSKEKYPGPWPTLPGRGYFQRYDEGPEVVKMQKFLLWVAPDCLPQYGADGEIGTETLLAVKRVQAIIGTKVDGFYGSKTQAAAQAYEK